MVLGTDDLYKLRIRNRTYIPYGADLSIYYFKRNDKSLIK